MGRHQPSRAPSTRWSGYLGTDYTFWAMAYDLPDQLRRPRTSAPTTQHSIVTSVDASSDGMTFTYHFRSGVKWSDGQPFTAEDAAWTLNYYKTNNVPNYSADLALHGQGDGDRRHDDGHDEHAARRRSTPASPSSSTSTSCPSTSGASSRTTTRARSSRPGFPSVGTGTVHHHELRQEPVRAAGPQPQLLGNRRRPHAARRPDHLPDLRQPGRRGRRPAVRRGRLRLLHVRRTS